MRRRVVVTGMGLVTPLGVELTTFWSRLVNGESGIRKMTLCGPCSLPINVAAEVHGWSLKDVGEDPHVWQSRPRQSQFLVGSGLHAARHAGLSGHWRNPLRVGISLGVGEPFADFPNFLQSICASLDEDRCEKGEFTATALRLFNPDSEREYEPHRPAVHLASRLGVEGPVKNCVAACASGTQAIGEGARLIRRGTADVMFCGGAHSLIHPFGVTGFARLSALSTRSDSPTEAPRPFDRERDGFVIGEGAAVLVLEELNHALGRGAEIWGEISGYGSAQDAYRMTDSHPDGRGTVHAIRRALQDAQLDAQDIDYVNAHGTGTVLNDKVETRALKQVFGSAVRRVPISSSKSMLGHSTTACGAIELIIAFLSLRAGAIHPTINYSVPDPECDLDYVPNTARDLELRHVLSQNIGFGGQNAAMIVSAFDQRSSLASRRAA